MFDPDRSAACNSVHLFPSGFGPDTGASNLSEQLFNLPLLCGNITGVNAADLWLWAWQ